nr:glycoside hydrolase family 78 protein [Mucilaginibacter straminoryzae]
MLPLSTFAQTLKVTNLRCDYRTNPLGIESAAPKLSWELQSNQNNTVQTAYQIQVADDSVAFLQQNHLAWDSKKVNSSASVSVKYAGAKLQPAHTYYWRVIVWDNHQYQTTSEIAKWQMGLPSKTDWKGAKWIAYEELPDSERIVPAIHGKGPKKLGAANDVLPLIRKNISIQKPVKRATMFICGLGHFELSINGKKLGDHFLDPGWTKYDQQALYVPFDVTANLKQGNNALGIMLGNGFYYIPRDKRYRKLTGAYGYPKMICRLAIEYQDGTSGDVVSDETWRMAPGPVTFSSIYAGEDYDATKEQKGWNMPGFDDSQWQKAKQVSGVPVLNAQTAEPLQVFNHFKPVKTTHPTTGKWVFDLGQNASGIPYIKVKGHKGDTVKITPSELINPDGTANQKGSGGPAYFTYVLKGEVEEEWQPQFTYYGFRYLQVEGAVPFAASEKAGDMPVLLDIQSLHTRNAAEAAGSFSCSNELFNNTFSLIDWAIKSNMASVFTDCPHREKLGWLEEAHLMGASIRYNYDIATLAKKCISDMRVAQNEEGLIPEIAPEFVHFTNPFLDSPEWGSNGIILPWYVYQWYGDKDVLAENYSMMKRYLVYLKGKAKDHILTQGLGDWYDIGEKAPGLSQNTTKGITATAIYYYDLTIAEKVARLLNKPADADDFKTEAVKVRNAFNQTFFNSSTKQYGTGSQTSNAMAVYMGLVEPQYKQAVVENIVEELKSHNNSLTAGDIGYRYLLRVLDDAGRSDVIYAMNNRSDVPGYSYQLAKGATALTESWQALAGVSNNHLMLGHLMEWFYSGLGGICQAEGDVAFKKIEIRPEVVGDITSARASYHSPYGKIATAWQQTKGMFKLKVEIPVNTTATVYLPAKATSPVSLNGKVLKTGVKHVQQKAVVEIGSGTYQFTVN